MIRVTPKGVVARSFMHGRSGLISVWWHVMFWLKCCLNCLLRDGNPACVKHFEVVRADITCPCLLCAPAQTAGKDSESDKYHILIYLESVRLS